MGVLTEYRQEGNGADGRWELRFEGGSGILALYPHVFGDYTVSGSDLRSSVEREQ